MGGILADWQILGYLNSDRLKISPIDTVDQIQPASVDLRLDRFFTRPGGGRDTPIDPSVESTNYYNQTLIHPTSTFKLRPGGFVLASTVEFVEIPPTLCGMIKDKSSLARLGLGMLPAGFIDPGFAGHITLEIVNHTHRPWLLYPGMKIAQLVLFDMAAMPDAVYGATGRSSRYQDQPRGPVTARTHIGWKTSGVTY